MHIFPVFVLLFTFGVDQIDWALCVSRPMPGDVFARRWSKEILNHESTFPLKVIKTNDDEVIVLCQPFRALISVSWFLFWRENEYQSEGKQRKIVSRDGNCKVLSSLFDDAESW